MGSKPGASTVAFCFQNALKLSYMRLGFQNFFWGYTPDPKEGGKFFPPNFTSGCALAPQRTPDPIMNQKGQSK